MHSLRISTSENHPAVTATEPVISKRPRLESIDVLRGVIMILMALDHTRDYFGQTAFSPTDPTQTTVPLFFTRWITHICAPVFFLLTGTGAYLSLRKKSKGELSKFLFTRGLWLLFVELTLFRCLGLQFNFDYRLTLLDVLWALGWAMIVLSALVHLPARLVIAFGLVLIGTGTWINSFVTADWGITQFALPQALRGAGFVCTFIPLTGMALGTLPPADMHNASGLFNVTRNLGGALGLAVISTLINQRTWLHWQQLAESTRLSREPVREALGNMQSLLDSHLGAASQAGSFGMLAQQAQLQAATLTYGDMYRLLAVCIFGALLLLPLLQKPRGAGALVGH